MLGEYGCHQQVKTGEDGWKRRAPSLKTCLSAFSAAVAREASPSARPNAWGFESRSVVSSAKGWLSIAAMIQSRGKSGRVVGGSESRGGGAGQKESWTPSALAPSLPV